MNFALKNKCLINSLRKREIITLMIFDNDISLNNNTLKLCSNSITKHFEEKDVLLLFSAFFTFA